MTNKTAVPAPLNRGNIKDLRAVADKALRDALAPYGIVPDLGRITFIPGREFRCKLTARVVKPKDTKPKALPAPNERWLFGGKVYRIVSVNQATGHVIGSRPSRARSAVRGMANYRIKLADLMDSGERYGV